jgi:hypothetical protein
VGFFVVPFSGPKRDSAHRELQLLETLFDVSIVLDPMDFECWRDSAEKGDSEQLENSYFEEISQTILLWGRSVGNSSIVSFDFEDMHDIFRRAGKMNRSRGMAFDDATSSETAERAMTAALAFANITESRALLAVISSLPELGQLDNFRAARKRLYDNCSPCSTVLMSHVVDFTVPKGVVQADVWYFAGSN